MRRFSLSANCLPLPISSSIFLRDERSTILTGKQERHADDDILETVADPLLPARAREEESSSGEKTGATVQDGGHGILTKKSD